MYSSFSYPTLHLLYNHCMPLNSTCLYMYCRRVTYSFPATSLLSMAKIRRQVTLENTTSKLKTMVTMGCLRMANGCYWCQLLSLIQQLSSSADEIGRWWLCMHTASKRCCNCPAIVLTMMSRFILPHPSPLMCYSSSECTWTVPLFTLYAYCIIQYCIKKSVLLYSIILLYCT